jgi:anti-sigma regulatory factor (Ser/Thr protein kinase)
MSDDDDRLDAAASLYLPPEPESAARARRFISELCRATRLSAEICDTASLLVSELVTNAIIHGKTSATIEVHRPPETLRVAVRDDNPVLPPVGASPTLNAESGRGLMIVSVLADAWGVEHGEGGKAIWFELRVH